jgi:hypothetical protein
MRQCLSAAILFGLYAAAAGIAGATTLDTFDFTQSGWAVPVFGNGYPFPLTPGTPDPGGVLTGSFTAKVGASPVIGLADLTSFSAVYSDTADGDLGSLGLSALTIFSYIPGGGGSALGFSGPFPGGDSAQICVGSPTGLDPNCTLQGQAVFNAFNLTGDFGVWYAANAVEMPVDVTAQQPVITLVSSVPVVSAPEPSSISLLAACLALLAVRFVGRLNRKDPASG